MIRLMWKADHDALMLQLTAAEKGLREQQRHNRTRETLEVANLQLSNKLKDTERRIAELECDLQRMLKEIESRQKIDAEREIKLRGLEIDDMVQKNTIKYMTAKIHKIEEDLGHAKGKVQQTEITLEEANALLAQTRANLASSQVNTRAVEAKLEAEIAKYNLLKDRIGGDMSAIESQLREEVAKLLERNAMLKSGKQKLQLQQLCERMLFQGRLAEVEGARSESDRVVVALQLEVNRLLEVVKELQQGVGTAALELKKTKGELQSEMKVREESQTVCMELNVTSMKLQAEIVQAVGKVQQTEITLEEANALLAQTRANLASSQVNTRAVEAKLEAEIAKYNLLKDRIGGDMSAIESQLREEVAKLLERNAMLKSGKQKLQLQQLCERMLFQGRLAEVEGARSESDRVVVALRLDISHLEETARDFRKVKRELEAQAASEKKARDDSEIRVAVAEQAAGERKKLQSQAEAALRDALLVSMCSLFSGVCIVCMESS